MDEKMQQQIVQLVQAAMQGDQQANQQIQQIAQAAQQGNQQAAAIFQVIQQVAQQMQGVKAAKGAKLNYLRNLKNICPEGEELTYMKAGGKVCPVCKKKKVVSAQGGTATEQFKKEYDKKKKVQPAKKPTKMPTTYDKAKHDKLIKDFQKNGRKLPQERMDSLQWYNRNDPNAVGV